MSISRHQQEHINRDNRLLIFSSIFDDLLYKKGYAMAVTAKAWVAKACHGCQGMGCPCQGLSQPRHVLSRQCHGCQGMPRLPRHATAAKACAAKAMSWLSRHATVAKACADKAMPWLATAKAWAAKAMSSDTPETIHQNIGFGLQFQV
jgi:hypothetical protein